MIVITRKDYHYIFLGGRDLEKGPWVSYLPFGRRFRCGCRYRCGGPYSFPGLSARCRGCARADRGGECQPDEAGAMTSQQPLPPRQLGVGIGNLLSRDRMKLSRMRVLPRD